MTRFSCSGHPRLRGEGRSSAWPRSHPAGSSPPARGRASQRRTDWCSRRVIPACAGKGDGGRALRSFPTGHPRLRGEGDDADHFPPPIVGSSPPARGRGGPSALRGTAIRVIPACAGKGFVICGSQRTRAGHPRLRGEGVISPADHGFSSGSSPPARGRAAPSPPWPLAWRVIPACAGKGTQAIPEAWIRAGHPRLRGEGERVGQHPGDDDGSSPPARGRAAGSAPSPSRFRVIPACAGKGKAAERGHRLVPGHPRLRGEGSRSAWLRKTGVGSSPPARGRV